MVGEVKFFDILFVVLKKLVLLKDWFIKLELFGYCRNGVIERMVWDGIGERLVVIYSRVVNVNYVGLVVVFDIW